MTSSMKRLSPFHSSQVSRLSDDRQQTAVRSAPRWSLPVGSVISRAQVRGRDLEAEVAVMLGHRPVHLVDEDDVGLAGREAGLDQLLEQASARRRVPRTDAVLGRLQVELGAVADRFHELVGDQHAVVEVERLAVEVARRLADLEELLDLGMRDVEIAGGRAAPQRALRDRQRQAVHHADERDDAAGLAVEADRLADAAHRCPNRCRCRRPSTPARHSRSRCRRCRRGCR